MEMVDFVRGAQMSARLVGAVTFDGERPPPPCLLWKLKVHFFM